MKSVKQTVYLPVKQGQTTKTVICDTGETFPVKQREGYFFTSEQLNEYTQSVIKQALETAAEKVYAFGEGSNLTTKNNSLKWTFAGHIGDVKINKDSITNTFEETFKLFSVE